jgi:hypothetical protein
MRQEPEQGKCLIGASPSKTGQLLSGWFHDYLWHKPKDLDPLTFHHQYPMLADRLSRHYVEPYGNVYLAQSGCWSASSLFADLMRSVNVPVRKVVNAIDHTLGGPEDQHSGLVFAWQGTGGGLSRYLLHTDQLYCDNTLYDPAPAPKDTERGVALWDHVWLDPNTFGARFTYDSRPWIFGKATWQRWTKYLEMTADLVSSADALALWRGNTQHQFVTEMGWRGWTEAEAEDCWNHIIASVAAYGDGDIGIGFQRLLDGPNSRHAQWCLRTKKCSP